MKSSAIAVAFGATALAGLALGAEGPVPRGIPHLDHVFVIMMENRGRQQFRRDR